MQFSVIRTCPWCASLNLARLGALACGGALTLALSVPVAAQRPAQETGKDATQRSLPPAAQTPAAEATQQDSVSEEALKQQLLGKPLYLRGGYLSDNLSFDEHGRLVSHSTRGSYTLCAIEIGKVRLTKHKLELEGVRYGLHFLGALPYEDPAAALDRVRISPKKKLVKITFDRERVVKPKKVKDKEKDKDKGGGRLPWGRKDKEEGLPQPGHLAEASEAQQATDPAAAAARAESPAEKEEGPADEKSVTSTTSPAHAAALLRDALDQVFAQGLDERMMAAMPGFWKLYYQAAAEKTDFRPKDPAVLRQNIVDRKARLFSTFEPPSNEYAQSGGVAGMALYHVVVGADGQPREVAVGRPIGFGLDENAVEAIQKARFEPAMKNGKPVPVMLDLAVQFRIYSKRTARVVPEAKDMPTGPELPGPYSILH